METIKLEKSGNFMWVTDLQTNTVTRFPAKDTYYSFEDKNRVLVLTWDKNNGEIYHRYNVSELVDLAGAPWSSFATLDTFLAENLGFNGGGGTSGTTPKVYTALLTQNGAYNILEFTGGNTVIGVTYTIYEAAGGAHGFDFTNVGAPNNNVGTKFVATGTTPNSWGNNDIGLYYDEGAPVATILENTIGNIWFEYKDPGKYVCHSNNLFTIDKTTINIDSYGQNGTIGALILNTTSNPANKFTIRTYNGNDGIFEDSVLIKNRIEIRVYN